MDPNKPVMNELMDSIIDAQTALDLCCVLLVFVVFTAVSPLLH